MKTIFDGKNLKRDGYERVIKKELSLIHDDDNFNDGIGLFVYINNYSDDIPTDWFSTDDYIDLELHFDINLIVDSLIDGNVFVNGKFQENGVDYICITQKKKFDLLQKQLIKALHTISKLEFISAEDYYGRKFKE